MTTSITTGAAKVATGDFDLAHAESVHMEALSIRSGADRIAQFSPVVRVLGDALGEVKRLRKSRADMLSDAVRELSTVIVHQLDEAVAKHDTLRAAVHAFRSENFKLEQVNGQYRWRPRPGTDLHDAIERLSKAATGNAQ